MFECQLSNNLQQVKRIFFVLEEYVSDNLTNIKISEGMQKTIPPTYCIFYILLKYIFSQEHVCSHHYYVLNLEISCDE